MNSPNPAGSTNGSVPAFKLAGPTASVISADVALDSDEPVVGSFAADGLTYAAGPDGLALVSADPAAASDGSISIPASVIYDGATYPVTAVAPYAFYLSGATDVALPASVSSVDERAFRSSDVGRVEVDPENETYASFDGALYDAPLNRLLLIPGGRQGAVRIPDKAEEVDARAFSHCAGVDVISADAGSAHFASWDGLLYDASGTTLLRVPAGATEITIRDGCTTIAAGAMEGCASLERIDASATVTSISPDVFQSVPTISLPAIALTEGAPQLTAMVALSSVDDGFLSPHPEDMAVRLPEESASDSWHSVGFLNTEEVITLPTTQLQSASNFSVNVGLYTEIPCRMLRTAYYAGVMQDQYFMSVPANTYIFNAAGFRALSITSSYYVQFLKSSGATGEQYDYSNFRSEKVGTYVYTLPAGGNGSFYWDIAQTAWVNPGTYTTGGTIYLGWRYTDYTIVYNANGGSIASASSSGNITQDVILQTPIRSGYTFAGWTAGGASYGSGSRVNIGTLAANAGCQADKTSDTITLTAQWTPTVSADVPLEVTARIDKLGLEEQAPAEGYIESRCGEALRVAEVACESQAGAEQLFGEWADQVGLEVSADSAGSQSLKLWLGADGFTNANSTSPVLDAMTMASYGTRIPLYYRFDLPSSFPLADLAEGTKPICQVSYTVALASA